MRTAFAAEAELSEADQTSKPTPLSCSSDLACLSERELLHEFARLADHMMQASATLGGALSTDEVARAVVQQLRDAMQASAAVLFVPFGAEHVRVAAATGYSEDILERFKEFTVHAPFPACVAMQSGTPLILQTTEERRQAFPHLFGSTPYRGSLVAWPLKAGTRTVGCLGFQFAADNAFREDKRAALEALAGPCSQALERARLYEAEQTARAEAESLHHEAELLFELTCAAHGASSLPELYTPALDALQRGLGLERAAILLFDTDGVMRFKAWRDLSEGYRHAVEGHSPWARGESNPRPITVPNVFEDATLSNYHLLFAEENIKALGFVPLVHDGQLLGKLMLYSSKARTFSDRELRLAQTIASQVAQAAARAELFERERSARAAAERNAEQTRRLQMLTAQLSVAADSESIAEVVIDNGSAALGALTGGLWLANEQRTELHLVRASNYPKAWLSDFGMLPLAPGTPVADAFLANAPVWLRSRDDYAERYPDLEKQTRSTALQLDVAIAAVPLGAGAATTGVIVFTFPGSLRFSQEERWFLEALSQQSHQALERARLYQAEQAARTEAEEAQRRAAFLAEASALLSDSLDYQTTLKQIAHLAVPKIGDWCAVDLVSEPSGKIFSAAITHVNPDKVALAKEIRRRYPPPPDAPGGTRYVIRTGTSALYATISEETLAQAARNDEHLALIRALGMRSAVVVPVSARGRIFGSLTLVSAESGRLYDQADLQMAEQLGRRIGAAIDNARLYEQAIAAVNLRDDFLSVAGHELKTPLTALLLQSDLLLARPQLTDPSDLTPRLSRLQRNAQRLADLVDELLDVSRITAGRLELRQEHLDLRALLEDVVSRENEQLKRSRCPITLSLDGPIVGFWDRMRLEQIVSNLLSNAMKYGANSPIIVSLQARSESVRLTVKDHGIGIVQEDQARIFQRFERSVSSREFGGLGLGLWIVRQIVEAHGGSIGVTSALGEGAEFWVELPLTFDSGKGEKS